MSENVPIAVVELGRPRNIAFTLGAIRRIKQVTGHSVWDENANLTDEIGMYLWAMLVNDDRKDITVEQIEEMIWPGNMDKYIATFNEIVSKSTPEGKAETVPAEAASPQA